MKKFGTLMALMAAAAGVEGIAVAAPAFSECPAVGHAAGCNVLITISADGNATIARDSSQPGYAGFDGTLVGVLNNWLNAVEALPVSGTRIFALSDNGMCSSGFGAPANCSLGLNQGDPYDYTGDLVTFSISGLNNGIVGFTGGLAPGASAYFSLEGVPGAGLSVGSPVAGQPSNAEAPEPATYGLVLGTGLLLVGLLQFRRRATEVNEWVKTSAVQESRC